MSARAAQSILDEEQARCTIEPKPPFMGDGLRQPLVPAMPAAVLDPFAILRERQMLGSCLLEHPEQPLGVELVLLDPVDHQSAMICRAAENIPCLKVGGVNIAPRVDDHGRTGA